MKRKSKGFNTYSAINLDLQLENRSLLARIKLLELQLASIQEAKTGAMNEFINKRIRDMNTVTRSISNPRKNETSDELGRRYISAISALHSGGIENAKQFFDKVAEKR